MRAALTVNAADRTSSLTSPREAIAYRVSATVAISVKCICSGKLVSAMAPAVIAPINPPRLKQPWTEESIEVSVLRSISTPCEFAETSTTPWAIPNRKRTHASSNGVGAKAINGKNAVRSRPKVVKARALPILATSQPAIGSAISAPIANAGRTEPSWLFEMSR